MTNALKQRLAEGKACIGAWTGSSSTLVVEAMASLGFHWMAVDMEHGTNGPAEAEALFLAAERHGCAPLARLPSADPYLARRLLDAGAAGVIVPVVEDAQALAEFARHLRYPPHGKRGVGLSRCNLWGDRFTDYLNGFQPVIVPQIETAKGVVAADTIAALAEVDALFLGPYDLSADLGHPGDFAAPAVVAALASVRASCERHGKAAGIHQVKPDAAELRARIDEGYRFIAYATDIIALRAALGRPLEVLGDES